MNKEYNILIIDDSKEDAVAFSRFITADKINKYNSVHADTGEKGLELCLSQTFDCILLDYNITDLNGIEFLESLKTKPTFGLIPVVMLTGAGNEQVAANALKNGAQDYLVKEKTTPEMLNKSIHYAIKKAELASQLQKQKHELRKTKKTLKETAGYLDYILKSVRGIGITGIDLDFKIKFINPVSEMFFSCKSGEVSNKLNLKELFNRVKKANDIANNNIDSMDALDLKNINALFNRAMKTLDIVNNNSDSTDELDLKKLRAYIITHGEYNHMTVNNYDQQKINIKSTISLIHDSENTPLGFLMISREISDYL